MWYWSLGTSQINVVPSSNDTPKAGGDNQILQWDNSKNAFVRPAFAPTNSKLSIISLMIQYTTKMSTSCLTRHLCFSHWPHYWYKLITGILTNLDLALFLQGSCISSWWMMFVIILLPILSPMLHFIPESAQVCLLVHQSHWRRKPLPGASLQGYCWHHCRLVWGHCLLLASLQTMATF